MRIVKMIAVWTLQFVVGLLFVLVGVMKFQDPIWARNFARWGYPDGFYIEEIDWIEASGHDLTVHAGRDEHLIRGTIKDMESRLDPDRFVRVHRSTIVNVDRIKELLPSFHGEYTIVLRDGTRLSSSRGHSERLQMIITGQR